MFFTLVALGVLLYTLYLGPFGPRLLLIAVFLAVALGPAVDHVRDLKLPRRPRSSRSSSPSSCRSS